MASLFRTQAEKLNSFQVGTRQLVLIEGVSLEIFVSLWWIGNFLGYNFGPEVNYSWTNSLGVTGRLITAVLKFGKI